MKPWLSFICMFPPFHLNSPRNSQLWRTFRHPQTFPKSPERLQNVGTWATNYMLAEIERYIKIQALIQQTWHFNCSSSPLMVRNSPLVSLLSFSTSTKRRKKFSDLALEVPFRWSCHKRTRQFLGCGMLRPREGNNNTRLNPSQGR